MKTLRTWTKILPVQRHILPVAQAFKKTPSGRRESDQREIGKTMYGNHLYPVYDSPSVERPKSEGGCARMTHDTYHWFGQHQLLLQAFSFQLRSFFRAEVIPNESAGGTGIGCRSERQEEEGHIQGSRLHLSRATSQQFLYLFRFHLLSCPGVPLPPWLWQWRRRSNSAIGVSVSLLL